MQTLHAFALAAYESDKELHRRMHESALIYGFSDVAVFQDAPRVFRNLAANAVIPLMDSFIDVRLSMQTCRCVSVPARCMGHGPARSRTAFSYTTLHRCSLRRTAG